MKIYYSGKTTGPWIGPLPEVTLGSPPIEMLARLPSQDCGCPEEWWRIEALEYIIHIEADGSGEIHVDAGEWQSELRMRVSGIDQLRAEMFKYHAEIMAREQE